MRNRLGISGNMAMLEAMQGASVMQMLAHQHDPTYRPKNYIQGNRVELLAATPNQQIIGPIGDVATYSRWKIALRVADPDNNFPSTAADPWGVGIEFRVLAVCENEEIIRTCRVGKDSSEIIYVNGHSLVITANNDFNSPLTVHYSLDDQASGLSLWQMSQQLPFVDTTDGALLNLPAFCNSFYVFLEDYTDPSVLLEAFIGQNNRVYSEVLAGPRSAEIPVIPGAAYRVKRLAASGTQYVTVLFECGG